MNYYGKKMQGAENVDYFQKSAEPRKFHNSGNKIKKDHGKNNSEQMIIEEQKKFAYNMRVQGYSFQEIADTMDLPLSRIYKWIKTTLQEVRERNQELVKEAVDLELDRLDKMLVGLQEKIDNGNKTAVDAALKIMERRSKLLGLDKPVKIAPTTPDGEQEYQGDMSYKEKLLEMMKNKMERTDVKKSN